MRAFPHWHWHVDYHAILLDPILIHAAESFVVPVAGGEHERRAPEKHLKVVQLGCGLPKNRTIHARLQNLLVGDDERGRRHFIQKDGFVNAPLIPSQIRMHRIE